MPETRQTAVTCPFPQVKPWFCSAQSVHYSARVAKDTGLPPGKLEDQMAACAFANLRVNLLLDDCRYTPKSQTAFRKGLNFICMDNIAPRLPTCCWATAGEEPFLSAAPAGPSQ